MGPLLPAILGLAALVVTGAVADAQDRAAMAKPSETSIVEIAQQFVLVHFSRGEEAGSALSFDIADIYPQESGDYWAVVGGFVSQASDTGSRPHAYGLGMRVVCAEHNKLECWRLEKLVIDQKVIIDD